jgi:PrgI family protein
MAIEAVKIPTNIQVEERIIGPLSLRQIAILLLTGGFSYVIWAAVTKTNPNAHIFLQVFCWIPMMIGAAFSFVQVNGVSLFTLVLLWVEHIDKPAIRTFGPRTGLSINIKTSEPVQEEAPVVSRKNQTDFSKLGSVLDAGLTKEAAPSTPIEHSKILDALHIAEPTTNTITITENSPQENDITLDDDNDPLLFRDIHA